ncbi:MAG: AEC family transporter [Clostridia bacterium]|nr:AEC family transporter [Clostridia bacterium]
MFFNMLNLQLTLLMLIAVGFLIRKINIMDEHTQSKLSDMLINVILPCNIVYSFMGDTEMSPEFAYNCILAFVISLVIQIFACIFGRIIFRKYPKEDANVLAYGVICSNSSFIGIPVVESLYNSIGVMYTSIFQMPIRFTMWSAGLSLFTSVDKKDVVKKIVKHPCIIAIVVGALFMIFNVHLPVFLDKTIYYISRSTTAVSMLIIGSILTEAGKKNILSKEVFFFSFIRLIAMPLIVLIILKALSIDPMLTAISVLLTAMPAGSTTAILAEKYGCNAELASGTIFVSTILSVITIPIISIFL